MESILYIASLRTVLSKAFLHYLPDRRIMIATLRTTAAFLGNIQYRTNFGELHIPNLYLQLIFVIFSYIIFLFRVFVALDSCEFQFTRYRPFVIYYAVLYYFERVTLFLHKF